MGADLHELFNTVQFQCLHCGASLGFMFAAILTARGGLVTIVALAFIASTMVVIMFK